MRVVLDSNILLASIGKKSRLRKIWLAFRKGFYTIAVNEDILKEYEEVLQGHAVVGAAEYVMDMFKESPDVVFQHIYYNWNAIEKDPDDNKFFDVAVASAADYLITDDRHFDVAKHIRFPSVRIVSSEEFMRILDDSSFDDPTLTERR